MASRNAGALLAFVSIALAFPVFAQANRAPVISGKPPTEVSTRAVYQFFPKASDPDRNRLTYSIRNKPSWAYFSSSTGLLAGMPGTSHVGRTSNIQISVSDGKITSSLPAFSITVVAPGSGSGATNRPPVISGSAPATARAGSAYQFQPTASDPERSKLTYSISNRPAWASFSSSTGKLSGTPGDSHANKTYSNIVIKVSDGKLTASLPAFAIKVAARSGGSTPPATNRPPAVSGTPARNATVGAAYSFTPVGSDPDGDKLTWSISGKPGPASFNVSSGRLSWTPSTTGSYSNIVITATDSRGAKASLPAFSVTVAAAPPTPVTGTAAISWRAPTQYTNGTSIPSSGLSGYRIYRGSSAGSLTRVAEVDSRTLQFNVSNLARGTHYFAVTAVSNSGVESSLSGVGSKTIQ